MFRKSLVGFGLVAMLSTGALVGVAAPAHAERPPAQIGGKMSAPPLAIDDAELDFGDVATRSKVTGSIRVRNVGDQPVVVTDTSSDCSCTALLTDGYAVIEPGKDLVFDVSIETRDMGVMTQKVRLICEGFGRPFETIVRANVTEKVEVNPEGVKALVQPMGLLTLKSIDDRPFHVLSVHGGKPQFVGFDPETDEAKSLYRVVYDFTMLPKEEIPSVVVVETDHPDAPFVAIRYFSKGKIEPQDRESNAKVWKKEYDFDYVHRLAPGESAEIQVRVAKAGRASRENELKVSSDNELLSVEIVGMDLDSDPKWAIATVRVTASVEAEGFQAATLTFTLGEERRCESQLFTRVVGG